MSGRSGGYSSRLVAKISYPKRGQGAAFPQTYFCKHPYVESFSSVATVSNELKQWNLNSIFAVRNSNDVAYATNLNTLYKNWVVLGVSWELQYSNRSSVTAYLQSVMPWPNVNNIPTDFLEMAYQRGCVTKLVSLLEGSRNTVTHKGYVTIKHLTGMDPVKEDQFWGTDTTAPALLTKLYMMSTQLDASPGNLQAYQIIIRMQFYVKWFNPHQIAAPGVGAFDGIAVRGMGVNNIPEKGDMLMLDEETELFGLDEEKEEGPTKKRCVVHKCYGPDGSCSLINK